MSPSSFRTNHWLKGLIVLLVIGTVIANCFYPNGTDVNNGFSSERYIATNPEDDFSMCCSRLGDQPRSDGLCMNADGSVIWRESCTDRTWQSSKCIKLCAGSSPGIGRQMDNDEQVTPCSDGSYCCGDGQLGSACCDRGRGVFLKDGTTQAANPSSTLVSSIATTTAGLSAGPTTNVASSPSPATSTSIANVNAGVIAGIVIGGLAGIVLSVLVIWLLFARRKEAEKVARTNMAQRHGHNTLSSQAWSWPRGSHITTEPQEAQGSYTGEYKRSELEAGRVSWTVGRAELGTRGMLPELQESHNENGRTRTK
ncbi:MAG: hypothetical protein Q9221_008311 [Calogaya cf. arnoldii]